MSSVEPVCSVCTHYNSDRTCSAYPGGIPDEMWEDGNHLRRRPDQAGDDVLTVAGIEDAEYLERLGFVADAKLVKLRVPAST